jgi:hypothetical protein
MTETEAAIRQQLARIGAMWPNGWTKNLANEYHQALNDIPIDELTTAITNAIRTHTYRPTPAQIRAPKEPTMTRTIDLAPHLQTPGPDGIRPYVHDAIRAYQATGLTDYLRMIRDAADELNDTEKAHIANLIHNDATAA